MQNEFNTLSEEIDLKMNVFKTRVIIGHIEDIILGIQKIGKVNEYIYREHDKYR